MSCQCGCGKTIHPFKPITERFVDEAPDFAPPSKTDDEERFGYDDISQIDIVKVGNGEQQ